jgi:hypothetical protein
MQGVFLHRHLYIRSTSPGRQANSYPYSSQGLRGYLHKAYCRVKAVCKGLHQIKNVGWHKTPVNLRQIKCVGATYLRQINKVGLLKL